MGRGRHRSAERAELSALQASTARLVQPKPAPPYWRDAQQLVQMAQFDSAGVLRAIETVRVPGVRVTALELSAVDATARRTRGVGARCAAALRG